MIAGLAAAPPGSCRLPSDAPLSVHTTAGECQTARHELERLQLRYAERHPSVIAAEAHLRDLERRFDNDRTEELQSLKERLASFDGGAPAFEVIRQLDARKQQVQANNLRRLLILVGNRIDEQLTLAQTRTPLLSIVEPCH